MTISDENLSIVNACCINGYKNLWIMALQLDVYTYIKKSPYTGLFFARIKNGRLDFLNNIVAL